jgi:antirestriction protein ArdC
VTITTDRSDLLASLTEGIANLTSSDQWQRYLDCQSRFYRYSANNVMLILTQRHEATRVAGFNAWKKLNRYVRKGEKAIWIVAPMRYAVADNGRADEKKRIIRGFKWMPVFDISSTEGDELPAICKKLSGDDPAGLFAQLIAVAESIGYHVEDAALHAGVNGDCTYALKIIRVEVSNSPAQRVKTLAHELGHAMLHEGGQDRALAEMEAESTAYVVCRALGIDSGGYSFGYVTGWAGDGEQAVTRITASCENIRKAASTILWAFEPREDAKDATA